MLHLLRSHVFPLVLILSLLVGGCSPAAAGTPTPTALPPTATPEPPKILRVTVPIPLTTLNPWTLFSSNGTVWDTIQLIQFYPGLFVSAGENQDLIPCMATAYTEDFTREGAADWTIQIVLVPDLKWSDGSPLTADDVVYTVTTAMKAALEGGFGSAFSPSLLKAVTAEDSETVKFTFSQKPDSKSWKRILTAPVLNKAYWSVKTDPLLNQDLMASLQTYKDQIESDEMAILEKQAGIANQQAEISRMAAEQISVQNEIKYLQDRLAAKKAKDAEWVVETNRQLKQLNDLSNLYHGMIQEKQKGLQTTLGEIYKLVQDAAAANQAMAGYRSQITTAIYQLPVDQQPIFSAWQADSLSVGSTAVLKYQPVETWSLTSLSRVSPKVYDSAEFMVADSSEALNSLTSGQTDAVLISAGSPQTAEGVQPVQTGLVSHLYLQFSGSQPVFSQPAVRQAIACLLGDASLLPEGWMAQSKADGFGPLNACIGGDEATRLDQAAQMLRSVGFSWGSDLSDLSSSQIPLENVSPTPDPSLATTPLNGTTLENPTPSNSQSTSTETSVESTLAVIPTLPAIVPSSTPSPSLPVSYIGLKDPEGNVVLPLTLVYPAGNDQAKVAQAISEQMTRLGFALELKELSVPDALSILSSGQGYDLVLNTWSGKAEDEVAGWCAALGSGRISAFGGIFDSKFEDPCAQANDLTALVSTMSSEMTILPLAQGDILIAIPQNPELPDLTQTNSGLIGSSSPIWWGFGLQ